jgi:hypothetical protein
MTKNIMVSCGTYKVTEREEVKDIEEVQDQEIEDSYSFLKNDEEFHGFQDSQCYEQMPKFVAHQQPKKRDIIMDDVSLTSVPSKKVSKESTVVTNGSYQSEITDSDSQKLDSFSENQSYNNSISSQSYNYSSSSQTTRADLKFHSYLQNKYSRNILRSNNGSATIDKFAFADMDKLEEVFEEVPQSKLLG